MPSFKAVGLLLISATSAIAAPWGPSGAPWFGHWGHQPQCLSDAQAEDLIDAYVSLTSGATNFKLSVADALLASNFSDSTSSVASVIDGGGTAPIPIVGETFNKESFIAANAAAADTVNVVLQTYHTCKDIFFRFEIKLKPQPVFGITILETIPAPAGNAYPYQIDQVYAEINSAAFLVDIGATITPAPAPSQRRRRIM